MLKKYYFALALAVSLLIIPDKLFADQMTQDECNKKTEGWYITGLPLINFTTDTGVGYGVRIYLYNDGERSQDYFCTTPYLTQIYAQFFQTTLGLSSHELHWDQYKLFGTNLRLISSLVYEHNTAAHYYGSGSVTTRTHGFISDGLSGALYHTAHSWMENFKKFGDPVNYHGFWKFNEYILTRPKFTLDVFGDIFEHISATAGIQVVWTGVKTWNGRQFKLNGNNYRASVTQLAIEHPNGFNGGWTNIIRFGIAYKTLDYEPDPTTGVHLDYNFETSQRFIGSDYVYYRNTLGVRYYLTVWNPLTFASRIAYTIGSGDIPFYEQAWFDYPFTQQNGLGGNRSLRGYPNNRFVGNVMTLLNLELRLKVYEVSGYGQRFVFKIVGFFDTGNVYNNPGDSFVHVRWNDFRFHTALDSS